MTYRRVVPGVRGPGLMPHSEAAMHLRLSGKVMDFTLLESGMVQIWDGERPVSFPVTAGEAGVHSDSDGYYCRVD